MEITKIDLKDIVPGNNDRTVFNADALQELSDSIKEHGLIQPITVREISESDLFEIVAGERRFRACQLAGMEVISAIIADMDDEEASAVMLSENIARSDLDPIDEAIAYQKRMDQFDWTIDEIAEKAGVSTIRVRFRIKLLALKEDLKQLVRTGNLSLGYAQIIASANLDSNFQALAVRALNENNNPTPGWFRNVCGKLFNQQAQSKMFEGVLFNDPAVSPAT